MIFLRGQQIWSPFEISFITFFFLKEKVSLAADKTVLVRNSLKLRPFLMPGIQLVLIGNRSLLHLAFYIPILIDHFSSSRNCACANDKKKKKKFLPLFFTCFKIAAILLGASNDRYATTHIFQDEKFLVKMYIRAGYRLEKKRLKVYLQKNGCAASQCSSLHLCREMCVGRGGIKVTSACRRIAVISQSTSSADVLPPQYSVCVSRQTDSIVLVKYTTSFDPSSLFFFFCFY